MTSYRLSKGGVVDRSRPIHFTFDGKRLVGFEGDSLASALMANGVQVIGRSFKYHRPRGFLAAGLEEPNAIMQVGEGDRSTPNLKATGVELYEGLSARSVNAWPSLKFDLLSLNSLVGRFLPAGFYYKTFMWPDWHLFEPWIRKAAGLGKSPDAPDPDFYDKKYAEYDIVVVGGGATGLLSALMASRAGARVLVVEHDHAWGGHWLSQPGKIGDQTTDAWLKETLAELSGLDNVTMLSRTLAFGYYDHNLLGLCERRTDHQSYDDRRGPRQRLWKVRAEKVVLATGAFERPMVFPNNDRPGVMLASAASTYVHRYGVAPGKSVLIATNNNSAYDVAAVLKKHGVGVVGIADSREAVDEAVQAKAGADVQVMPGTTLTSALGRGGVTGAMLHKLDGQGKPVPNTERSIDCDCILTSAGWSPAVHLFSQSGGKLRFDDEAQGFLPDRSVQAEQSVGAAAGHFGLHEAMEQTGNATLATLSDLGLSGEMPVLPDPDGRPSLGTKALWFTDVSKLDGSHAKAWVDYQNDVTASDIKLALRENFRSVEHVKRYTTNGMASDQGKTSNVNAIGIMSETLAAPIPDVGTTKFRPPYDPTTIGVFAGRRVGENLMPLKILAADRAHETLGGVMEDYGGWRRPAYYAPNGEGEEEAVAGEVKAVRGGVGLFEASPLGKIEVFGPDAAEFLNRIYVNTMKTLKPQRCRYGLMLDENGVIFDDGVLACLSENHYLVGTTSGHAQAVTQILQEWLQCEWVDLNVAVHDVTTSWAVMNVNGPHARDVLSTFETDIDLSAEAFPHMHMRQGQLEGVPCRIQRVSFTGELSYEVAVPWRYGASFFDRLMEAGKAFDITPFGVEALMVMRIEKGFLHVGSDTDGMTLPQDVGFGRILEKKKADFVGRRSTMRADAQRTDRRVLVGLETVDDQGALPMGGHIVDDASSLDNMNTHGWITSTAYSHYLDRPVALGLVARGRQRMGEEVTIWDLGTTRKARIVEPAFYDPEGVRLHG